MEVDIPVFLKELENGLFDYIVFLLTIGVSLGFILFLLLMCEKVHRWIDGLDSIFEKLHRSFKKVFGYLRKRYKSIRERIFFNSR